MPQFKVAKKMKTLKQNLLPLKRKKALGIHSTFPPSFRKVCAVSIITVYVLYKIDSLPPTLRPRSSTSTASCGRDHITNIITCHLFSPDDNFITSHNFQILLNARTERFIVAAFAVTTTALLELLQLIPEDATLKEDAVLFSKIRDPC